MGVVAAAAGALTCRGGGFGIAATEEHPCRSNSASHNAEACRPFHATVTR
jgi:hypothetical protein